MRSSESQACFGLSTAVTVFVSKVIVYLGYFAGRRLSSKTFTPLSVATAIAGPCSLG